MNTADMHGGDARPSGALALTATRDLGVLRARRDPGLTWKLKNWIMNRWKQDLAFAFVNFIGRFITIVRIESRLYLTVLKADGTVVDLGLVGRKVVTTAGVGFIVDAFQNLVELEIMKYHGFGTGTGAESSSDTALGTEFTTEYAVDSTRPTGTTTEGASGNIYRTVATFSPDSGGTLAVTEHGVFSATSSGVLLDRTKFSAVNLTASADSLQATYEITFTAGS